MNAQAVVFKGTKNGLRIYVAHSAQMADVLNAISGKLQKGKPFFEGATVNLSFIGREFSSQEQTQLLELFSQYMTPGAVEFKDEQLYPHKDLPTEDSYGSFEGIEEGMTRFVRGTVRSGQRIFYEGNVVVIGDVNPGGEVIAGGNILVLGILRGIAHAGATGNHDAIVASYSLQATQLRIAGYITRAPEGETGAPSYLEVAFIKDNQLFIEPYLPGKGKPADSTF
ncbi:MAG: septum site-determining protein MinC [Clostridiales bacterium]|nr:septum site-determining protein MinC [Clostridiales bacterium]